MAKEDKKREEKIEQDNDERIVITVRCKDMPIPATKVFKIPCSECGEMTWISTSFQFENNGSAINDERSEELGCAPEVGAFAPTVGNNVDKAICEHCFFGKDKYIKADFTACVTEKCLEDAVNWAKSSNIERIRNMTEKEIRTEMLLMVEDKIKKQINVVRNTDDIK